MEAGKKYSDEEILKGIERNDITILEYFYNNSFRSVRYMVNLNHGSEEDAKDVYQEALVVLFRKLKESNFVLTSSVVTYLYSISRIIWIREIQRRNARETQLSDSLDEEVYYDPKLVDLIERNDRLRLYRQKFEELSEDCKRILQMFLNNIPTKEITRLMGYRSEQHTKNRRFRCKKSLVLRIRNSSEFKELGNEKNIDD